MDHEGRSKDVVLNKFKYIRLQFKGYLLIVMRSIIVCEFGSSTGSSIKVAISGSRSSSGASSN